MKPSDTNEEHNDPVWELLKSAAKTGASPTFVQNTVREARLLAADDAPSSSVLSGLLNLLRRPAFSLPLAVVAAVTIAVVVNTSPSQNGNTSEPLVASNNSDNSSSAVVDTSPVEVPAVVETTTFSFTDQVDEIDYLGDLVVVTDPGSLNDQMLADLFY